MKQVAEIMYVVESEREEFLKGALTMEEETKKVLWECGVRNQQYFALNEYIFMTFFYDGDQFKEDMNKMSAYLEKKGHLITKRRKDVPLEERASTNWWAPVKKLGSLLEEKPGKAYDDGVVENYMASDDGGMSYKNSAATYDTSFDEEEWMEDLQIWKNL